jgi:hypothetical protein
MVRGLKPGGGVFPTSPDRSWGPLSLLYSSFPNVKRLGRCDSYPTSSSARVKERVLLKLYSPSGISWPVLGWTLLLCLSFIYYISRFIHDDIGIRRNVRIPDCTLNEQTVSLSSYKLSNFYVRIFYKISLQSTLLGSYLWNLKLIQYKLQITLWMSNRLEFSGRVIGLLQRPLPDNTQ